MEKNIIQQLKKLKAVKPDNEFIAKNRLLILAISQNRPAFVLSWSWAGAFAAIVLMVAISVISGGVFSKPSYASLFNPEDISKEFSNLTINIQLEEITYRQNVNSAIASALNEISDNGPQYLNQSLLEQELNSFDLNGNSEKQQQIDDLLKKLIN